MGAWIASNGFISVKVNANKNISDTLNSRSSLVKDNINWAAPEKAVDNLKQSMNTQISSLVSSHQKWWNDFYTSSFISIPDTKIESFYWIQMYKYACAARKNSGIIDAHGPWLKKSINYYLHLLEQGEDGKLHLPPTYSPEYGAQGSGYEDCNFDLAMLRWGWNTLLEICDLLQVSDPLHLRRKKVLNLLVDYPKNTNGFMIGSNQPYEKSHRHFSHLLMIYPL